MAARLTFTADGFDDLAADLADMEGRAVDWSPWFSGFVVPLLTRSAIGTFEAEGRPVPWPALSEATVQRRRNEDKLSVKMLRDTGMLWQSIGGDGGDPDIMRVDPASVTIGTAVEYGAYHQEGTATIPARPFLLFQEEDLDALQMGAADWILYGLQGEY
jgi:phage gpG-like protein